MKLNVRIEFDIEGDVPLNDEEIKEMIHTYLSEAMETDELDYSVEAEDDELQ
jgi:hypothetical protein